MTPVQRYPYLPGDRVLVEGVVQAIRYDQPFGEVSIRFAEATDPSHLLDGVEIVAPQIIVNPRSGVDVPSDFTATEGYYQEEQE